MNEDIIKLMKGNERLSYIAETDWLTGLYNRGAVEKKVNLILETSGVGIMLAIDVDHFKQINDRFGHIAGDHVLQQIARILKLMVLKNDIVARIGGDEFVIYLPVNRDKHFAEERGRQIKERLAALSLPDAMIKLSVSVGWGIYEDGDDYQTIFDRADQNLLKKKQIRDRKEKQKKTIDSNGIEMDVKQIRQELSEQELIKGAYCQDFETFKGIYRFMERRLHRSNGSVYIILFTLTNGKGDLPSLSDREVQMIHLRKKIQGCLRSADVFTQYSSGQFLVMVSDVTEETAEMIAVRIQSAFYTELPGVSDGLLLHHCYPLTPAEPTINTRLSD